MAAFTLCGKLPQYPLGRTLCGPQSFSWYNGGEKNKHWLSNPQPGTLLTALSWFSNKLCNKYFVSAQFCYLLKFCCTWCRCVASSSAQNPVLYYGAVVAQVVAFLLALAFMLLYYWYFHPSGTSTTLSKSISITDPDMDLAKPSQSKQFSSQQTL